LGNASVTPTTRLDVEEARSTVEKDGDLEYVVSGFSRTVVLNRNEIAAMKRVIVGRVVHDKV
jgi:hypothetical protein